jgi:hypothetical protein
MSEPYLSLDDLKQSGESLLEILRACEPALDYDERTITWLDGYVNRNRHTFSEGSKHGIALGLGAVLGEATIRAFGGEWEFDESRSEWFVKLAPGLGKCNPIGKSFKVLSGEFESLSSFFNFAKLGVEKGGIDKIGSIAGSGD